MNRLKTRLALGTGATAIVLAGLYTLDRQATHPFRYRVPAPIAEFSQSPQSASAIVSAPYGPFTVKRVRDGDTLVLANGDEVRLIGVDTPEMRHANPDLRAFAQRAKTLLTERTAGGVTLRYDSCEQTDRYHRTLAYAYAGNIMLNEELIRRGYAYVYERFEYMHRAAFLALQEQARKDQVGLWSLTASADDRRKLASKYQRMGRKHRQQIDALLNKPTHSATSHTQSAASPIRWQDAGRYQGEHITVEGTIVATHNSGKACFLNFHKQHDRHLSVVIFRSSFARFPNAPEEHYLNRSVRVSGLVRQYNGRPEIVAEYPTQIQIRH